MCCLHRFLDYHQNGLFPTWETKFLFVGTFNPSWNKPGNNADYFYGRSAYFWKILPRFFGLPSLQNSSIEEKIRFCQDKKVGFTDLIKAVNRADYYNQLHKDRILSFKDSDLLLFGEDLQFNTPEILHYIDNNNHLVKIFFTLLGQNVGLISQQMSVIEDHFNQGGTNRLHTHTGQGLRGIPRDNALTQAWYNQGLNFVNATFDLALYPFNNQ